MGQRERGKTAWKRPRPEWRKAGKREKRWKAGQRARRESVTERLSDRGRSTGGNEVRLAQRLSKEMKASFDQETKDKGEFGEGMMSSEQQWRKIVGSSF